MEQGELWMRHGLPDQSDRWLRFRHPKRVLEARSGDEVAGVLTELGRETDRGAWGAGFMGYEAAAGMDPAFATLEKGAEGSAPLCWFGIYDAPEECDALPEEWSQAPFKLGEWESPLSAKTYEQTIARIRELIAAGDTYQVNFTYPLAANFEGDPRGMFAALWLAQPTPFAALLNLPGMAIASASPELFFRQDGDRVVARPMKGTARRGRWLEEDRRRAAAFASSEKERAENVMIVDLLRNDLGKIARAGSVKVESLFDVERYPTLLQMTSTIAAQTGRSPVDVLRALFPCGSITGAPKIRAMQIIAELEGEPRGAYTGAIGLIAPDRRACFSVAIRTVEIGLEKKRAAFGVGGGITWGSDAAAERRETLLKAELLFAPRPAFELLEAMLWLPGIGFPLIEFHMDRLRESAAYFEYPFEEEAVRGDIEHLSAKWNAEQAADPHALRLSMNREGRLALRSESVDPLFLSLPAATLPPVDDPRPPRRAALSNEPVNSADPMLFHKTTLRARYERPRAQRPDLDDMLLINERGELTESCRCNIVLEIDGKLWTPSRECGLLSGAQRRRLMREGIIRERILRPGDIDRATGFWLINALRGWMPARLAD